VKYLLSVVIDKYRQFVTVGKGTSYACQFVDTVDRNPKNHHVLDTFPVGLTLFIICRFSFGDKPIQLAISFLVL
jgi:hypothetical protein